MYDPQQVLASLDQHKWNIIALCSLAMLANYTYFIAAVRQGFRDRAFPVPVFCTLFWLVGDASIVLSYDVCFHVYNHWYLKLFWGALCITVLFELLFLYMILRFGRGELLPSWSQTQFAALIVAGVIVAAVTWAFLRAQLDDPLFILYFHLANMAGPPFYAAQLIRRRSTRGTNPLIWLAYTVMVASWFLACTLWFGPPFASALFVAFYAVCTAGAAVLAVVVRRMAAQERAVAAADPLALQRSNREGLRV